MLLIFILGAACGGLAVVGLLWWWAERDDAALAAYRAKQDLAEIERQTIRQLLVTEMAARRTPAPGSSAAGSTIIEGSAVDIDRAQP